jgi:hypothetical protein
MGSDHHTLLGCKAVVVKFVLFPIMGAMAGVGACVPGFIDRHVYLWTHNDNYTNKHDDISLDQRRSEGGSGRLIGRITWVSMGTHPVATEKSAPSVSRRPENSDQNAKIQGDKNAVELLLHGETRGAAMAGRS